MNSLGEVERIQEYIYIFIEISVLRWHRSQPVGMGGASTTLPMQIISRVRRERASSSQTGYGDYLLGGGS